MLNAIGINTGRIKTSFRALPDKGVLAALTVTKPSPQQNKYEVKATGGELAPTMAHKLAALINAQ